MVEHFEIVIIKKNEKTVESHLYNKSNILNHYVYYCRSCLDPNDRSTQVGLLFISNYDSNTNVMLIGEITEDLISDSINEINK